MRIHYGPVIIATEAQPNHRHRVLVPWIKDPRDTAQLFTPAISEREAHLQRAETLDTDQGSVNTRLFQYVGDQYQTGSSFWVDERGLLQRYRWQQDQAREWDTRLESLDLSGA